MVDLDWRVESHDGVTLVELFVENPAGVPRRVRVRNCLDGPVWPPRREGVPEAGWDDGGFEGIVAAGERRPLGYASPASLADPPVELVWTERAGESERDKRDALADDHETVTEEATPEGVVRALGDPRPPGDVVPRPDAESGRTPPGPPESRRSP